MPKSETKERTRAQGRKTKRGKAGARASKRPDDGSKGNGHSARSKAYHARLKETKLSGGEIEQFLAGEIAKIDGGTAEAAGKQLYESLLGFVRDAILVGRPVNLHTIGTLKPYRKGSMSYRHPKTGEMCKAPARKHVSFQLSVSLKSELRA